MLQAAWKKMSWSLAQRGVWGTLRVALRKTAKADGAPEPVPHVFDTEFGVETSGFIGPWQLGGGGPNQRFANPYYGVPPSRLREALVRWQQQDGVSPEAFAFVDIGCGKGRAMMIASETPFRMVCGVELSAVLLETGRRNLERWRQLGRARCALQMLEGDAITAELPPGPWLIFLYNPFQATVMRKMLQRLDDLAGTSSGQMYVLYFVPQQEAVFDEFPSFRKLWSEVLPLSAAEAMVDPVSSPGDRCSLYLR